jgi:pimeloyl-ACP methyl ester carboxylesterase
MQAGKPPWFQRHGASTELVVFLHGFTRTPADMAPLARVAREEMPNADTWAPPLPIARALSRSRASDIVSGLLASMDELVARRVDEQGSGYNEIVIVGHSFGAVMARAVWALAMGGQPDGSVRRDMAKPWADRIRRLVLLAAVARGWNTNAPVSVSIRINYWLGGLWEILAGPGFAILDLRRGSPFLTTTRLQNLSAAKARQREGAVPPVTVQLLGTVDDVVAPADNVDLAVGSDFHYVEVPDSSHLGIVQIDDPKLGALRRKAFRTALAGDLKTLRAMSLTREEIADMVDEELDDLDLEVTEGAGDNSEASPPVRPGPDIGTVVFITHGIRDYGFWTRKLAVRVKQRAREAGISCRTVTSSYGFLPIGPFLLKTERRKRVGWLMDQYVSARASYPDAHTFCFIGHSNGT